MAKTVVGQFDSIEHAQQTVRVLINSGIPSGDIKVAPVDPRSIIDDYGLEGRTPFGELIGTIAVIGALLGLFIGLLAGGGFLGAADYRLVPPGGTLLSALGVTVVGLGVGTVVGAIVGAIIGLFLRVAGILVAGVRRNRRQVTAQVPDSSAGRVRLIMHQHDAVDISWA